MKVFIDTNILLEMYHLSGPDLEELRKVVKLVETGKIELLLPQQVVDEFWRNREGVIADALKRFRESKAHATMPNVIRDYPEARELRAAVEAVNALVRVIETKVKQDIEVNAFKADEIIQDLFASAFIQPVSTDVIDRARLRAEVGNPPGKKGSLGDAINWEWLLQYDVVSAAEIFLISGDGDFESELVRGTLKQFLQREWTDQNPGYELRLERSLVDFLYREFPEIELAGEVEKVVAIEGLEEAGGFSSTHVALRRLSTFDDFTDAELQRLLSAYLENNQVYWILGDEDVRQFAFKLVGLASGTEAVSLAGRLKDLLAETEVEEDFGEPPF